jgi:hypothetical protein
LSPDPTGCEYQENEADEEAFHVLGLGGTSVRTRGRDTLDGGRYATACPFADNAATRPPILIVFA